MTGAGVPGAPDDLPVDPFGRLWTPHRMAYIQGESKPTGPDPGDCPFCRIPSMPDEAGLVVARGDVAYVVLNRYPYNAGHVLVCPYRHVADFTELDDVESAEVTKLTQAAVRTLRNVSGAQGFNLGMNLGPAAGAGIAAHLHQHVVPRWGGDTNFMPVVGQVKVLPQLLLDTRSVLAEGWSPPP